MISLMAGTAAGPASWGGVSHVITRNDGTLQQGAAEGTFMNYCGADLTVAIAYMNYCGAG